jgi:hypothetical protein
MMRLGQWIIVLILTGIYALSSAEIYRYVDEKGKVHYTDDLGSVPVEQRPKADEYEVPYDQSASEEGTEREKPLTEDTKEDIEETEGVSLQTEAPAKEDKELRLQTEAPAKEGEEKTTEQKLTEVGARLTEEYQALVKEREKLDKISTMKLMPADHRELVKRIRDYNSRTEDYERRRAAFNQEVEAYNASIRKEVKELR